MSEMVPINPVNKIPKPSVLERALNWIQMGTGLAGIFGKLSLPKSTSPLQGTTKNTPWTMGA